MSRHVHVDDELVDFSYGELADVDAARVRAHLDACPRCSQAFSEISDTRQWMSALPMNSVPRVSVAPAPVRFRKPHWRKPAAVVGSLVAVGLALFVVLLDTHQVTGPSAPDHALAARESKPFDSVPSEDFQPPMMGSRAEVKSDEAELDDGQWGSSAQNELRRTAGARAKMTIDPGVAGNKSKTTEMRAKPGIPEDVRDVDARQARAVDSPTSESIEGALGKKNEVAGALGSMFGSAAGENAGAGGLGLRGGGGGGVGDTVGIGGIGTKGRGGGQADYGAGTGGIATKRRAGGKSDDESSAEKESGSRIAAAPMRQHREPVEGPSGDAAALPTAAADLRADNAPAASSREAEGTRDAAAPMRPPNVQSAAPSGEAAGTRVAAAPMAPSARPPPNTRLRDGAADVPGTGGIGISDRKAQADGVEIGTAFGGPGKPPRTASSVIAEVKMLEQRLAKTESRTDRAAALQRLCALQLTMPEFKRAPSPWCLSLVREFPESAMARKLLQEWRTQQTGPGSSSDESRR